MADVALGRGSPRILHATNLILHLCNVLLLFALLRSLTGSLWRSAFVAALFAVHPLHVESVAWIVERKDCLSTLFWLLTTIAYVRYARSPGRAKYAVVVVLFALGLMSKPMLVTLPLTLLLLDYWPLGRSAGTSYTRHPSPVAILLEKAPLLALSAVASVVTIWAQSAHAISALESLPLGVRLANSSVAYVAYICKMFWPTCLAALYPHPGTSIPEWQVAGAAIVVAGVTALAVVARRRCPHAFVGWLWYLITLVPVIGLVQVGEQAMADRYTYVPLIGLFILIAWMPLPRRLRPVSGCASAIAIVALTLAAHTQAGYWRDSTTLWRHALDCNDSSAQAHRGMANALRGLKETDEAIVHIRRALEIKPDYAEARVSLGTCLAETGHSGDAEAEFRAALEIDPRNKSALHNLAILLSRNGRHSEAKAHFDRLLRLRPDRVPDLVGLGNSLIALGDARKGVSLFRRALRVDPTSWDAANNLAWAYATSPDPEIRNPGEAVRLAKLALPLRNADRGLVLDTLAAAYAAAGDFDRAVEASRESIRIGRKKGQNGLVGDSAKRLRLYESRQAYVQPAQ
jgi:tetratricopeptide (TPR) repeat protein